MESQVSFAAPTMPRTTFPLEITWTFSEPVGGGTLQGAIAVAMMDDQCVHQAMQVSERELLELLADTRLPHTNYWATNALAAALEGRPPADNFLFLRLEAEATGELICQEIFVGNGAGADLASVSRNFPAKHNFYNERLAAAHREDAAGDAPSQEPVTVEDVDAVQKCKVVLRVIFRVSGRSAAFRVRPGGEILVPSKVTADEGAPDLGWTEATPHAVEGRSPAVAQAPLGTHFRPAVLIELFRIKPAVVYQGSHSFVQLASLPMGVTPTQGFCTMTSRPRSSLLFTNVG